MRPNINERIAKHNANNAERERNEAERVTRAVAHMKLMEEFSEWKERMRFDLYLTAEDIVRRLEDIRNANEPKLYGEWNTEFCRAIELLPEARMFSEEAMMNCTKERQS